MTKNNFIKKGGQSTIKLQKAIANVVGISRRAGERLIEEKKVKVNGEPAHIGQRVELSKDKIEVAGKVIGGRQELEYLLLYKPRGYVTTRSDESGRKTVMDLLPKDKQHLFPVGRLDMESEGLLLMTNDGKLAHILTHPSFEVEKTYHAYPDRHITSQAFGHIKRGSLVSGKMVVPVNIHRLDDDGISITITSGQKHVVRKILARAGYETTKLIRVGEGALTLEGLENAETGKWRNLTPDELRFVQNLSLSSGKK